MTTERIDIVVNEDGSRVVKKRLEEIGQEGRRAGQGTNVLKQALQGLAVGATLAVLQRTVDTYSQMISRLRLVTSSSLNLKAVNDQLFASANRTRSSYDATVELYAKLATGARSLGVSQQDLLGITETVNQAIQVSGATATEAAGGLRQLGQAIASGTLRGDELNSILENMPRLAQAIADGMGITVGQLRAAGAEGEITASKIINALKDQAPTIAAEFARVQPTIGSAFQVFSNNFTRFIGELDQATGFSATLARGIMLVANNLDVLAAAAIPVGVALLVVFGAPLLGALSAARASVLAFTAALAANPLGLLAVALSAAVAALLAFGDSWKVTKDGAVSFLDVVKAGFGVLWSVIKEVSSFLVDAWNMATSAASGATDGFMGVVGAVMKGIVDVLRATGNFLIGVFVFGYNAVTAVWKGFIPAMQDIGTQAINGLIGLVQAGVNKIVGIINHLPGVNVQLADFGRLNNANAGAAEALGQNLANAAGNSFRDYLTPLVTGTIDYLVDRARNTASNEQAGALNPAGPATPTAGADDAAKKAAKDAQDAADILGRFRRENRDAIRLAGEEASERRVVADMLELDNQLREKNVQLVGEARAEVEAEVRAMYRAQDIMAERDRLMESLSGREEAYRIGLEALNQVVDRGAITQDRYNQELDRLDYNRLVGDLDGAAGAARGLLAVQMELRDEASRVERATVGIWQNARGPLIDYQAELQAIGALYGDLKISGPEAMEAINEATIAYLSTMRDAASGARRALLEIGSDMTDAASNMERVIRNAFSAAEDALTDFIVKGSLDLEQFWTGLQEDLARSFVRENILGPVANFLGLSGSAVGIPLGEKSNPMYVRQADGGIGDLTDPATWWERAQEGGGNFFERMREGWSMLTQQGGLTFSNLANMLGDLISSIRGGGGGGGGFWSSLFKIGTSIFGGGGGPPSDLDGLYATGTSFRVGGAGGVDSQRVSFWASPGEDVTVSRPGQKAAESGGGDFYSISVDARGSNDPAAVEEAVERGIRAAEPVFIMKARRASAQDVRNTFGRQKL